MPAPEPVTLAKRQVAFGYTFEDQRILMAPMARDGVEGVGSMGNDTPLGGALAASRACCTTTSSSCSRRSRTRRSTASARRSSLRRTCGWAREGNLLDPRPGDCRRLELNGPVLTNEEFAKVRRLSLPGLKVGTLRILFRAERGEDGLVAGHRSRCARKRMRMIDEDEVNILILSDRGVNKEFAAIPSLLAVSGLHHYLIRQGLRMKVSLALETGEAREVHHFALLIGYGCSVINPYLAFETLDGMIRDELLPGVEHKLACKNFAKAAVKGVVKVMSKMGISAVQSYRGAQVFEAVGLRQDVIDEYFTCTASRVGGVGLDVIAREVLMRHTAAFAERKPQSQTELPSGGQYQWRADGEFHLFNPESIHRLQKSVRTGSYATYKSYAELIDDRAKNLSTLRGLLDFKQGEVDPDRGSRIRREHHEALQDRRHELRLHLEGSARDAGHRHEPHRRQEQHRRRRRRSGSLRPDGERRLEELGHQAGRVGPLRRDQPLPRQRQGTADQDGAGREARRRRPAARHQGVSVDREDARHHRGRGPDLAAAAPRHLFDRRSGGAHPRSEERQPRRAHQREAGRRSRRGHHRRRRRQGARGRGADLAATTAAPAHRR